MNSDEVFQAIEEIAAHSAKKTKQELVAKLLDDELGERVLRAAYDPFITYGIAKVPAYKPTYEAQCFDEGTWLMLERLAKRELTGNAAKEAIAAELSYLTDASAELLKRILTKDLRAGFTDGTINRACPGTIVTFDCMLAHPFSDHKHKVSYPVQVEPKLDGVRVLAFVDIDDMEVHFFSRSGKQFTTFDHLKEPLINLISEFRGELMSKAGDLYDKEGGPEAGEDGSGIDCGLMDECYASLGVDEACYVVLDGEVVAGSFNKTVGDVRRKDAQATDAKFCVFDLLTREEFSETDSKDGCYMAGTYMKRRQRLELAIPAPSADTKVFRLPSFQCKNEDEVHARYELMRERGLEGVIVKDPNALYFRKRSNAWLKIKADESVDVKVVDAIEGTGKYAGMLGALVVDVDGVRVNVGTGFSDEQRQDFWKCYQRDDDRYLLGRTVEVGYHEKTPDGALRHPRFMRFRDALTGAKE